MAARKMPPGTPRRKRNWKIAPKPRKPAPWRHWKTWRAGWNRLRPTSLPPRLDARTVTASCVRLAMPRGLNGTHRELSLAGVVALVIWRPPALQAREDPNTNGECGAVRHAR